MTVIDKKKQEALAPGATLKDKLQKQSGANLNDKNQQKTRTMNASLKDNASDTDRYKQNRSRWMGDL